ncbi:hypothetical protein FZEAL_7043 [Fusarium zealandicum]|uniref:Cell wall glycoprotein n=1 Tax=Fusarium zealandicum TaxID=1053134 RepID=A0A8H4XJ10_9HYPO|nr:hypothetical protein FZEAL_7043 [Fusarium zealandicum]
MGFIQTVAVASLVLGAAKASPYYKFPVNSTTIYTTQVVTAITTYCPGPTTLTHGDNTYTVTEATTLTITDCPCTISKPVKPTGSGSAHAPDACAVECWDKYGDCRTAPDANFAACAANFAGCLGYNPFETPLSTMPTACSTQKPKPTKPSKPVYTTEVVTAITTYCPEATTLTYHDKTYTVTKPTTLTITDCDGGCTVTKPVEPTKPVYTTEVVTAVTTYCPETTTLTYGNKTIPVTEPGTVVVTDCYFTTTKPVGPPPPKPTEDKTCAAECEAAWSKCRGGADANHAYCAASFAECIGYNPWASGEFVTPTACSDVPAEPTHPAPGKPTAPAPGKPTVPAGGNPPAPSNPTVPTAPAPGHPTTPAPQPTGIPPVVTAGAGRIVPAGVLAIMGAIAML